MSSRRFRIIDADGHVMEPMGMWERYIDPAYREQAPRVTVAPAGHIAFQSGGRRSPRTECVGPAMLAAFGDWMGERLAPYIAAGFGPESQIRAMDDGGVEVAFLYPTQGLYMAAVDDLRPARGLTRGVRALHGPAGAARGDSLLEPLGLDEPGRQDPARAGAHVDAPVRRTGHPAPDLTRRRVRARSPEIVDCGPLACPAAHLERRSTGPSPCHE